MTQPSVSTNRKAKRFPRLRHAFWRVVYGTRKQTQRAGYYAADAGAFWRHASHVAALFPRYVQNYAKLYRIYKKSFEVSPRRKTIVISLTEHLGDIVACEPVARHVREQNPDAHIVWVVHERYKALVEHNPFINQTLTVTCLTQWMQLAGLPFIDQIIELHLEGRACKACRIPLKKRNGNPEITVSNYYAYGNLQTGFLLGAGLPPLQAPSQLYLPASVVKRIDHLNLREPYIVLHTRSNETSRDWLPERWRELVAQILAHWHGNLVEVGVISGMQQEREQVTFPRLTNLCGKLEILETAEVIRRAQVFIGIDSGPAHLANALNVPGIILLGKYRAFDQYMPYAGAYANPAYAELLHADESAATIPVEQVYAAVMSRLTAPSRAAHT